MKDDPELQIDDTRIDDRSYSRKRRGSGPGENKSIWIFLGILLVLVFAGGIVYFFSRQSAGGAANPLEAKVIALEEKISGLEKQLAELQGRIGTLDSAPALLDREEPVVQKGESPGKQKQPTGESRTKPSPPSILAVATEKQYHTVQKGETLQGISKKYKISVEQLRKLNHLSANQGPRPGQKLLVSPGR